MKSIWFSHLRSPEEKKEFKEKIVASYEVLERLEDILETYLDEAEQRQEKLENYELSSWPYLQADAVGEKRIIKKLLNVINLTRQE